ncbi:MAG: ABC transporter permease [bacterium]|nr:ABC transporter permease [bacterium]
MEIRTILKKDIKKKKGIFICIALLTLLIVTAFLTIFGVNSEYKKGRSKLIKDTNTENILCYIYSTFYDSTLNDRIKQVEGVSDSREIIGLQSVNNNHRIRKGDDPNNLSKVYERNTYEIEKYSDVKDHIKLFNSSLTGYTEMVPLEKGEIYLPLGLKDKLHCNIGDYYVDDFGVTMEVDEDGNKSYESVEYQFKIKGFVASPMMGSYSIGWKEIFISDEDFNDIYELSVAGTQVIQDNQLSTDSNFSLVNYVYKVYSDGSMSDANLSKKVTLETKLGDLAEGLIIQSQSTHYTGLYIAIVGGILVSFVIILVVVVLIVISNSVSGEIESDYKKFGILKALGFSNFKIGLILSLLYIIAETIGIVLGLILSIFLKVLLGRIFVSNTGSAPYSYINISNLLIVTLIVLGSSLFFIFIKLLKIRKISPIKAINGNSNDIYFSPRINAPLTKKGLSFSISLKQILFSPVRYLGIAFVMAFLAFAMLTGMKAVDITKAKSVAKSFGVDTSNLYISCFSECPLNKEMVDDIISEVSTVAEIDYHHAKTNQYFTFEGDQLLGEYSMNPESILSVYKGRKPIYDNEFVTTKNVCEMYDLKIGDKVRIASKTGEQEFILVGIYQSSRDTGMTFSITYDGAKKVDESVRIHYMTINVKDDNKVDAVINKLNEINNNRYKVYDVRATAMDDLEEYTGISLAICAIILVFSSIFALVTIRLITVKSFIQERIDLGIYKANGFNTFKLRNAMAIRFMIVAFLGIVLGCIMSMFLSDIMLGYLLNSLGLGRINSPNKFTNMLIVTLGGILIVYLSAYIASRRIKKVSIRELVVE